MGKIFFKFSSKWLAKFGQGESIGVCYDILHFDNHDVLVTSILNGKTRYMVYDTKQLRSMRVGVLKIEEGEYVIVEWIGDVPEGIYGGWRDVTEVFFSEHINVYFGRERDVSSERKRILW